MKNLQPFLDSVNKKRNYCLRQIKKLNKDFKGFTRMRFSSVMDGKITFYAEKYKEGKLIKGKSGVVEGCKITY